MGRKLVDLFIPTERNNYRAKLLHLPALGIFVFAFLLFRASLALYTLNRPAVLGYSSQITPQQIIKLTNTRRKKHGLGSLSLNKTLSEAAQRKAADMFAFNYWSHNSPSGRSPWDFFKEVNYNYTYAGENLARDFQTTPSVIQAWMDSPSHRENILEKNYQEIGVAVVDGSLQGVKTTLVVQMFGTPTPAVAGQPQTETEPEKSSLVPQAAAETRRTAVEPEAVGPTEASDGTISRLWVVKIGVISFLGTLLLVLVLDKLVARRKKLPRLRGDNVAHIGFLLVILIAVLLFKPGAIL